VNHNILLWVRANHDIAKLVLERNSLTAVQSNGLVESARILIASQALPNER
jgi:hypothetical protein